MSKLKVNVKPFNIKSGKSLQFMSLAPRSHAEIVYELSQTGISSGSVFWDSIIMFVKNLDDSLANTRNLL